VDEIPKNAVGGDARRSEGCEGQGHPEWMVIESCGICMQCSKVIVLWHMHVVFCGHNVVHTVTIAAD
jgi:hypothetical protein